MSDIFVAPAIISDDDARKLPSLIESAVDKRQPSYTLQQLNQLILYRPEDVDLDPLAIVPLLLPSSLEGAEILLETVGSRCSPREALIAIQEAVERLERAADDEEDTENDADNVLLAAAQIVRIIQLYAIVLPRLEKRKKTASEILRPLISQVQGTVSAVSQHTDVDAQNLVWSLSGLTGAIRGWVGNDPEEQGVVAVILCDFLREIVQSNANSLRAGLIARAFERQYPNLRMPIWSIEGPSEVQNAAVVSNVLDALSDLGLSINTLTSQPSISSLILIAHSSQPNMNLKTLGSFLPIILGSMQSNAALDETLSVLLESLGPLRNVSPRPELSVDLVVPLVHVLAPLAGVHPDPTTRHATYRILSLVLSLAPSLVRLKLLKDLVTDDDESMQKMSVAAIGLVKEAILEALSKPPSTGSPSSVFSSPLFMQELGSILFLRQPNNLTAPLVKFLESSEPLRLVESLGLLYVLLLRDVGNTTGVRERGFLKEVQRTLLDPLKLQLDSWEKEFPSLPDLDHAEMQLGIIDMWLDRISSAIVDVSGESN
ncbi:unnamed protein product [Somion occarium]|uniref:Uncharacterized protein n=1 Tax=Somion occarium TaxID=3059160 RepID=A0ABP1DR02_9APHY